MLGKANTSANFDLHPDENDTLALDGNAHHCNEARNEIAWGYEAKVEAFLDCQQRLLCSQPSVCPLRSLKSFCLCYLRAVYLVSDEVQPTSFYFHSP